MKTKLIELSDKIHKFCVGMEGNISAKNQNKTLLIKASGSKLSNLKEDDIILYDFNNNQLSNFDKNYVIQYGVSKPLFLKHRLWHAFFMSINFQTTTAYMPLNCKSLLSNLALNLQIIETFLITFLFLII